MSADLDRTVHTMNRIRRTSLVVGAAVRLVRALLLGGIVLGIWALVRPDHDLEQLVLALIAMAVGFTFSSKRRSLAITKENLLMALGMKHADTKTSVFRLRDFAPDPRAQMEWAPLLEAETGELKRFETGRIVSVLSTLVLPALVLALVLTYSPDALKSALDNVSRAVAALSRGATLTVKEGSPHEGASEPVTLSSSDTLQLELLAQNMIEIKVVGVPGERPPRVDLKRRIPGREEPDPNNEVFQSFQLTPVREPGQSQDLGIFVLDFAVTEDVEVYLSTLSDSTPAAEIKVQQLPVPKVRLSVTTELKDPWPDDKPLPLRIDVTAENPLAQVRLLIKTGGRTSSELVNNVMAPDKTELSSPYELLLESYVQSDVAEVEIVAEAIDRALPNPLVGRSPPLNLRTASAYGRYRQTLDTLREMKSVLDEAVSKQESSAPENLRPLAEKVMQQAEDSPFFDGLDRLNIGRFQQMAQDIEADPEMQKMLELSEDVNDFLFEHESLDDKERDRDFFVAARAISRLLEQDRKERPVEVKTVTDRTKQFLDERHQRWELRVKRLGPESTPATWAKVKQKPFDKAIDQIAALDGKQTKADDAKALTTLSQAVADYRTWIEELEAKEDEARARQEQKRQEGLANARNVLRELQKRQGDISSKLDRAASRPPQELEDQWPAVRMDQNANIEETGGLEAQLRTLSPTAGDRIKAAMESMKITLQAGNGKAFAEAESGSDLAGRLLRQADSAARKAQQKQQRRGRRRRVTGDNYYGQQIVGGDVEIRREYEVSRRYREDILEDVKSYQSRGAESAEDSLLENYLRKVIR